jgi:hypothetical protein
MNKFLLQITHNLKPRLARTWRLMLVMAAITTLLFYIVNQFAIDKGLSPGDLTRNPNEITDKPFYTGGIASLGFLLWSATAAFLFMGAVLLHRQSRKARFLLSAGTITSIVALDDAFQLHNAVSDHLGIPEIILYAAYFLLILAFLLYFFGEIVAETDFPLLAAAMLFMGVSIAYKVSLENFLMEGGFKLLGITFWLAYFSRTAVAFVKEHMRPA